jgi:hypothetical protein
VIESRIGKIFLGLLTILPIAYMFYFFSFAFSNFGAQPQIFDEQQFNMIFKLHIGAMVLTFGLLIFYIVHLFRTEIVANDKKALWAVVLFFGNMIAMIVYWFLYIWPDKVKKNAP